MQAAPALTSPPVSAPQKRSFLQLPVPIDVPALLADYRAIPQEAWKVSHWEVHCSSAMVLLRGGKKGTTEDFTTQNIANAPLLSRLPYLSWLVSDEGPFGPPAHAFIFRMKPLGVAQPHIDDDAAWEDPFRIHVPITTNDGALLLAEQRAKHLCVGEVWTFDNQQLHAVTNGDTVRAHLIVDVHPNPRLNALLERARFDPGQPDPAAWQRASLTPQPTFAPFRSSPLPVEEKLRLGLDPEGFASRITSISAFGRLAWAPVHVGDVLHEVDGVRECAMARTATEYLQLRHQPGDVVTLGLVREGRRVSSRLALVRNVLPTSARRALWRAMGSLRATRG